MQTITSLNDFINGIETNTVYPEGLSLFLNSNQLCAEEAKALAMALQSGQCPPELRLNVAHNCIGAEGAKALAMALQSGQCLPGLQLNLAWNEIEDEGAKALALALQSGQCPPGLQLNLGSNKLGAEGAKALAIALQSGQCPLRLQLDLSNNQLGAEGAKALALALQSGQCPPRLQLNLAWNEIRDEGAKALALALQSGRCPPGLQLELADNQLGAEYEKNLQKAWAVYEAQQQDNFIKCMTLYQGHSQVATLFNQLPLEILQEIYSHILPATPILAKMIDISTKVFRQQFARLALEEISEPAKQLDNTLAAALSAKKLTEKASQIKTAINNFVQQQVALPEPQVIINFPTVALLVKFHLLTSHKVSSLAAPHHQPDELEGQPLLKKMRL